MEFVALIHSDQADWESMNDDERQAVYERYVDFGGLEGVIGGSQLQPTSTATTVQVRNGERLVTDGPYAEIKEALGGYYILEADSIDEACRLAAGIPAAERSAVEVRPIYVREES